MRTITTFGAAALALAIALPAAAQTTGATPPASDAAAAPPATTEPPATDSSAPAPGADTGAATSASATVAVGQPVKDKTGATIGQVTEVKPDPSGKQVATIKMGADTFAVDTSSLAVDKGAATINATQAEIKGMMKK